jgi:hypothetical protein
MKFDKLHQILIEGKIEQNLLDITDDKLIKLVDKTFDSLASAQRGKPEHAMNQLTRVMYYGTWAYLLEHVGDLTHRMAQNPTFFKGGYEWVKEKVERALLKLEPPSGWLSAKEEITSEFETIAKEYIDKGKVKSVEEFRKKILKGGENYARMHQNLTVYNEVQEDAKYAAISVGKMDLRGAKIFLRSLKRILDKGEKAWQKEALKFTEKNGKILPYK